MNNFQQCGAKATCSDAAISLKPQTVTTVLTKYDKAGAAVIGTAIGTVIAHFIPMDPQTQGVVTGGIVAVLTWLIPNKGT